MLLRPNKPRPEAEAINPRKPRHGLFGKYVALFVAVVCTALITNGLFEIWFSFREQEALLGRIQRGQAEAAAAKIGQFIEQIRAQIEWTTQFSWSQQSLEEQQADAIRLLRLVPAVVDIARVDPSGHEQLRVSRLTASRIESNIDVSLEPGFVQAKANQIHYGPVYFRQATEPYMLLAVGGKKQDVGVTIADVSLKYIWDVISSIRVGQHGAAYVVDANGKLIAHPDLSLVLRNTDLSSLAQVQTTRSLAVPEELQEPYLGNDLSGRRVISASAGISPLGWRVFVELPVDEAFASIYASIERSAAVLLASLVLAAIAGMYLARRMVVPIRSLSDGAAQIGSGNLAQRIAIKTGDEVQALGDQFNSMAAKLQDSYATLERKVEERTHQLELANLAKSRFLAAASHDLRQPLHALGLFFAQLRVLVVPAEQSKIFERVDAALAAMNKLFNAILDISKLDAGVLNPNTTEFPMAQLLTQIESTIAEAAREKGLSFRVIATNAWLRSDFILLERILLNLVSNAVHYTTRGGVVVGCRKRGGQLRIEVWDTGPGIPANQHQRIFGEFYRLGNSDRDRQPGLGLGLAIVDRLCRLLDHPIELTSTVGRGSRFTVVAPLVATPAEVIRPPAPARPAVDVVGGKLVVVIDDDPLVLTAMGGLLQSWGCLVVTGSSCAAVLSSLAEHDRPPDLIVSDYRLSDEKTGIEAIELLRSAFRAPISAFLLSGDTSSEPLRAVQASGYHLLLKPADPMTLRAMVNRMLRKGELAGSGQSAGVESNPN